MSPKPHRHELSDEEWARLAPLLPPRQTRGRYYRDHRTILNGMLWVLHTGAPWRDLPERYGPWKTVYERFRRWAQDGTFDRALAQLQARLEREGRLDWELWCIDGTSVRAHKAAAGAGEKSPAGAPAGAPRPRPRAEPRRLREQAPPGV
jgi:transposase